MKKYQMYFLVICAHDKSAAILVQDIYHKNIQPSFKKIWKYFSSYRADNWAWSYGGMDGWTQPTTIPIGLKAQGKNGLISKVAQKRCFSR